MKANVEEKVGIEKIKNKKNKKNKIQLSRTKKSTSQK